MAPLREDAVEPLPCDTAGCDLMTKEGASLSEALVHLAHHMTGKHFAPGRGGEPPRTSAKVETWKGPKVTLNTVEGEWHYFICKWEAYKVDTKASSKDLLEELWACLLEDLERLTFNEGKKSSFTMENLIVEGIKATAVTEQHPAVHMLDLKDAKQTTEETAKGSRRSVSSTRHAPPATSKCASRRRWYSMSPLWTYGTRSSRRSVFNRPS